MLVFFRMPFKKKNEQQKKTTAEPSPLGKAGVLFFDLLAIKHSTKEKREEGRKKDRREMLASIENQSWTETWRCNTEPPNIRYKKTNKINL